MWKSNGIWTRKPEQEQLRQLEDENQVLHLVRRHRQHPSLGCRPHCYCTFIRRGRYTNRSVGMTRTVSLRIDVVLTMVRRVMVYHS